MRNKRKQRRLARSRTHCLVRKMSRVVCDMRLTSSMQRLPNDQADMGAILADLYIVGGCH